MTKDDFLWYAVEITTGLQRLMYVRDWDIYIALAKESEMKTDSRAEVDVYPETKRAYMRFREEYWLLFDDTEYDIIDIMYESITHELSHLWFKEGGEEHVCSMITKVVTSHKIYANI